MNRALQENPIGVAGQLCSDGAELPSFLTAAALIAVQASLCDWGCTLAARQIHVHWIRNFCPQCAHWTEMTAECVDRLLIPFNVTA